MLTAKACRCSLPKSLTLTTCYGIPVKGQPGYISDDENEATPATAKKKSTKWDDLDPIGSVHIPHHSERGYAVPDEGHCKALNDETSADQASNRFREAVKTIGLIPRNASRKMSRRRLNSLVSSKTRFPSARASIQRS